MEKDRVILHCDMNNFFASVELLDHPELKDKPVAVCGDPEHRHGIILAKNQAAKALGIVTAETLWSAKKKCPDLVLLKPHMSKYKQFFKEINKIYQRYTDMVEPFSIDESWLDVTGSQRLFGTGKEIADEIRETVKKELGLTLSAGVSFNKTFAKMGSEYKKPDATTVISRENFKELLWPMPAGEFFGVGRKTVPKLAQYGINTIGDIALADKNYLMGIFGKSGAQMWEHANGIDNSPVMKFDDYVPAKSIGNGVTFRRDISEKDDILVALKGLSDSVAKRLRKEGQKAWGVKVDIKDPYFKTISRQKKLKSPTWLSEDLAKASYEVICESWEKDAKIRMITITAINLTNEVNEEQISIFSDNIEEKYKSEQVEFMLDEIRKKYGDDSIGFASVVKNDLGI